MKQRDRKMELVTHIEALNAKTQLWIDEDPKNRFGGMLVTDPAHWADYGVTTPKELDRYLDEQTLYEMVSYATSKSYARHVVSESSTLSDEAFQKEMDYWSNEADNTAKEQAESEKKRITEFEAQIKHTIAAGAGDRETAIRWIVDGEGLADEKDMGYICYSMNLPYSFEKEFEQALNN